ncbi:MAG: glutathione-disulfide reductase [Rhodocyclaceae bacterium]|nr:glutathione-disulfide reductase [Rhodocyclaceae bacterium]
MSEFDYDLITIGAGSGGVAASRRAALHGARVAICEGSRVGGTCVIRGCVPKKILMYASQFGEALEDAPAYGWQFGEPRFDLATLVAAKNAETDRLEGIYRRMLADGNVTLIEGWARLVDAHTVEVGGRQLTAGRVLIASGGAVSRPPIEGIELALDSDQLLDLAAQPGHLLVLGAGYIAVEFAGIFRGFGSRVTLAFRGERPIRGFDEDLRVRLADGMAARGIDVRPGFEPVRIERRGSGFAAIDGDGNEIVADAILAALGRHPNTAGLGLEALGVRTRAKGGAIEVDRYSRTSVDGIYAVGDVTDRAALTPVAIAEGRAFADTEFGGLDVAVDHALIATAVFSQPQIATIGLSEQDALSAGHDCQVFEAGFRPMKNTISGREERAYMKVVVDRPSDRVLGAHMIGPDAAEIMQTLAIAITMGARKADLDRTLAVHPTTAEEFVLLRTPRD